MRNDRFTNKHAVITGGSSGIGLALARAFVASGAKVSIIGRNQDKLHSALDVVHKDLPGAEIFGYSADVSDFNKINRVVSEIASDHGNIDILINNAGIMTCGLFEKLQINDVEKTLQVNYLGMLYTLKAAFPYLKKSTFGHVVFISSVAGYAGLMGYSAYAPSKFALTGFVECIKMELEDYNIMVSIVYPPDTETPMLAYERKNSLHETRAINEKIKAIMPEIVARKVIRGIEKRKFEIYCNLESRLVRIVKVLMPSLYFRILATSIKSSRRKYMANHPGRS